MRTGAVCPAGESKGTGPVDQCLLHRTLVTSCARGLGPSSGPHCLAARVRLPAGGKEVPLKLACPSTCPTLATRGGGQTYPKRKRQ